MGVFGTVTKFAGGLNWIRIALIAGIAVSIFGLGYMKASQVHAKHEADEQKRITAALVAKEAELREIFTAQLAAEDAARNALQKDLTGIRSHRDSLIAAIRNAQLTKPVSEVRIESCMETDGESDVQIVIANPFGADFVGLWNDASRGRLSAADTDTETD
jgi:hypothetical protein